MGIGDRDYGALPIPVGFYFENKRIKDIAVGVQHSLVLKGNGKVWGFGSNSVFQIIFF